MVLRVSRIRFEVVAIALAFLASGLAEAFVIGDGQGAYSSARSGFAASAVDAFSVTRPSARGLQRMVYDSESHRAVLYGGASDFFTVDLNDVWVYDMGAKLWTELYPATAPPLGRGEMAYDSQSDRAIFYHEQGQTWSYDLGSNAWTNMAPATAPPAPTGSRRGPRMAYDSESDRIMLFGGRVDDTSIHLNDTWAYDFGTNTWSEMRPTVSPPARLYPGMTYDATFDRVILFGGAVGGSRFDDTWAYDYNTDTWTSLNPSSAPSPRGSAGMVYDSLSQRVILFGGVGPVATGEIVNNETWSYDFATNVWTKLTPVTSPGVRAWHAMVYAGDLSQTILFGGGPNRQTFTRETWSYDSAADRWALVDGPTPPTPSFAVSPPSPVTGQPLTFDASASSDADGSIVSFSWNLGDGATLSGSTVRHVYVAEGTYDVTVTVTDDDGLTNSTTKQVVVAPSPDTMNPSIAITFPSDGATLISVTVAVTGTASDNVGLTKVELSTDNASWLSATGTTSWSGTLALNEGPNTIYARAVDTSGNAGTTNVSVVVSPPPPPRPPPPLLLIGGMVAGIVVTAIAVGLLFLRRKHGP